MNGVYNNIRANISPYSQTRLLGWDQNVKTFSLTEYGHVAYQIKGNKTCDNMQANDLTLHTTLTSGMGSKGQNTFLLKVVVLQIRGRLVMHIPWSSPPWVICVLGE